MNSILIFDAVLYGATASILCLSARELRLLNLSAGLWLVTGGWLSISLFFDTTAPLRPWYFIPLLLLGVLQVASPLRGASLFRRRPLIYLFVSLGVAIAGISIAQGWLLESSSSIISTYQDRRISVVFVAFALGLIALAYFTFKTKSWAQLVLQYRLDERRRTVAAKMVYLLFMEWLALLVLGALGAFLHKGLYGAGEHLTLIPILAVVLAKARPLQASGFAATVTLFSHMVDSAFPLLTGFSTVVTMGILVVLILIFRGTRFPLLLARNLTQIQSRAYGRLISDQHLLAGVALIGATLLVYPAFNNKLQALENLVTIAVLVALAWLAQRQLGVLSVGWLALGTAWIYTMLNVEGEYIFKSIISVSFVLIATLYLWELRILSQESALVIDLAVIVILHTVAVKSPAVSGADNIRFVSAQPTLSSGIGMTVQILLALSVLSIFLFPRYLRTFRAAELGLTNLTVGLMHRTKPLVAFSVLGVIFSGAAILTVALYHAQHPAVSPDGLSLTSGLEILLFGILCDIIKPATALLIIFGFHTVIAQLAGAGIGSDLGIGLGFLLIAGIGILGKES